MYSETPEKSSENSSPRAAQARRTTAAREARRQRALRLLPMRDLFTQLGLVQNDALVCPFCGTAGAVTCEQVEPPQMACNSCGKKGHLVQVVKAARKIRDWDAIAYLEKLAVAPVVADSPAAPATPAALAPESAIVATPVVPASEPEPPAMPEFPAFTPNRAETYRERVVRIKETCRLEAVVEREAGVTFKRVGANLFCNCPFPDHADSSPSLAVSPDKQLFHCLGCGKGGDVISFIELYKNLGFREALDYLDPQGATAAVLQDLPAKQGSSSPQSCPSSNPTNPSSDHLVPRLRDFFHERLLESREAQEYLALRGLKDAALIKYFHLGFDDGKVNHALTSDVVPGLKSLGFLNSKNHSRFYQCITVGLEDGDGKAVSLYGRRIKGDKGAKHQFPQGKISGIFHARIFQVAREIILTEGVVDALSLWLMGFPNVSCVFSATNVPQLLIEQLLRYQTTRIYLALDNDAAGEAACERLRAKLSSLELGGCHPPLQIARIHLPAGIKDANELLVKYGREQGGQVFGKLLAEAISSLAAPKNQLKKDQLKEKQTPTKEEISGVATDLQGSSAESAEYYSPGFVAGNCTGLPGIPLPATHPGTPSPAARPGTPTIPQACPSTNPVNSGSNHPTLTKRGEDWELSLVDRDYRIRGLAKNLAYDTLRINLRVARGDKCHLDNVDMCQARQRAGFVHQAAQELGIPEATIKNDIGKLLLAMESLQDKLIQKTLQPDKPAVPVMSERERAEAEAFLRRKDLTRLIVHHFHVCGLVGEDTNCLVGYLAAISRKLDDPLALIIQSLSAAGKTALMDAILIFCPNEEVEKFTAMSGQSLFYFGDKDLAHKILAISEQQGAEKATYAIKILQSDKVLKIASTGKDPKTGKMITHEYFVQGPVMLIFTTTSDEIDEELLNRCLLLTSNISREQTAAIHKLQREKETLAGMLRTKEREEIIKLHQNAQRLLRPVLVVNPYAEQLTFLDNKLRTRRDHAKYLTLIKTIAFLHQYQREIQRENRNGKSYEYIEVTLDDIALANQLAGEVMGTSLDELPPQTRKLLGLIQTMMKNRGEKGKDEAGQQEFTQREVRDDTGWGQTQVKIHLQRLLDMEYLTLVRGGVTGQRHSYKLLYQGEGGHGHKFLLGLADVEQLRQSRGDSKRHHDRSGQTGQWSAQNDERSGSGRPQVGPRSAGCRTDKSPAIPKNSSLSEEAAENCQNRISGDTPRATTMPTSINSDDQTCQEQRA